MKIYIVGIPWDSYSIEYTRVFINKDEAEKYCKRLNSNGYENRGVFVCIEEFEITNNEAYSLNIEY